MSVTSYVNDIKDTVSSIFEGMAITFSHLVRRPMTIQYPDKIPVPIQETLPHRYRGILEVDMDICTGCLACERVCPITCITIGIDANKETKQRVFTHFDIDIAKCMYCGLCSEVCPTGRWRGRSRGGRQLIRGSEERIALYPLIPVGSSGK